MVLNISLNKCHNSSIKSTSITVRIIALTTVINKGDQWLLTAKSQLAQLWEGSDWDPCIRSCHSHYGMWHSVAPAPVAWCILMSKMLWVRATRHGWYGKEKPRSITRLSEGTSQYTGFLGLVLSTVQLQCHISCFDISRVIDTVWN